MLRSIVRALREELEEKKSESKAKQAVGEREVFVAKARYLGTTLPNLCTRLR